MPITPDDIREILFALNQTGQGIPLTIQSTAATEPTQFWLTFVLAVVSSAFMIIWLGGLYLQPALAMLWARFSLFQFKRAMGGRHFILIKHTRQGMFDASMIDSSTLHKVEAAINSFKGEPFDLILHTPGGVIFYTQMLAKIIKESKNPVRCFVPYYAMSGGTMLALSCKEIYMGDFACLGPVDPQIGSLFGYGSAASWNEVLRRKGRKAGDSSIQFAFMGKQYTRTLRQNLQYALSDKITDPEMMDQALDYLTSGTVEHGYQISPLMLANFGIHINQIPADMQKHLSNVITRDFIEGVIWG